MAERAPAGRSGGASYAAAGVDIAAGDEAVERIGALARLARRPEVVEGIGGFGGLFSLDPQRLAATSSPVLVATTDGVGTKLLVARAAGRYDTVGIDLVAMCVDDLVCCGAEPLFLLDYVATGRLVPERIEQVVAGVAEGCRTAGCALLGGETAEHPDAMAPEDLDLAGFAVGMVARDELLGPDRVRPGDTLVGLLSPGLRSNGYSLARSVLLGRAARSLDEPAWAGAEHTLADELLRPSRIYAPAVRRALAASPGAVHAVAHVTGGGLAANVARVLPPGVDAEVRRGSWPVPRIFDEISRLGRVDPAEMSRVFNLGLGMVMIVDEAAVDAVADAARRSGEEAVIVGRTVEGGGEVRWA